MSIIRSESSPDVETGASDPLAGYAPVAGSYDELLANDGNVRPQWRKVIEGIAGFSEADRQLAFRNAQRMLHQNGMTYVARDDPDRRSRPWQLDLLPMLIEPKEWHELETGLIQRAQLLNLIVRDLYGQQTLINQGALPGALVFGNPQFLRACHGITMPGGIFLHLLAFDLARGPDGRWWILSDRTQTPSGAGYALENRIVASRCLPDLFASSNVQRLASFFRAFSEGLLALPRRDAPLAVVLSPGPCDPDQAGICLALTAAAVDSRTPLLGVCLGHQTIGQAFGGKVVRCHEIVHGKMGAVRHRGQGVFAGLPSPFQATRYHSLVVERDSLPDVLEITAELDDGVIMGLRHRDLPVEGVQFHPESIATEHGHKLLKNFLDRAPVAA